MFGRLLWESFVRQKRRKGLAAAAILLGTTAVTAMLALALTIGDRIHNELAVYGANIVVTPKADALAVNIGGVDLKPATGGAYLQEASLEKLKTIFWANNITGVSPELTIPFRIAGKGSDDVVPAVGLWFNHPFGTGTALTGAPVLHPSWKLQGAWPQRLGEVVLGSALAKKLSLNPGSTLQTDESAASMEAAHRSIPMIVSLHVSGVVSTGDADDDRVLLQLPAAQTLANLPGAISRVDISARTKPEDAFARVDPDTLPAKTREIWYCRPYANSIAYQIREAIPGADAQQVRRVEQSEGTLLRRISGLMWLVSAAALLAAGFAVSAAMATAVLERRREIGLMRSLGASRSAIALLFYAESGLLAAISGAAGYLIGSLLAYTLGARIFPGDPAGHVLNGVLLPVMIGLAILVAVLGSTPSIRAALAVDPSAILREDL